MIGRANTEDLVDEAACIPGHVGCWHAWKDADGVAFVSDCSMMMANDETRSKTD